MAEGSNSKGGTSISMERRWTDLFTALVLSQFASTVIAGGMLFASSSPNHVLDCIGYGRFCHNQDVGMRITETIGLLGIIASPVGAVLLLMKNKVGLYATGIGLATWLSLSITTFMTFPLFLLGVLFMIAELGICWYRVRW
ncbi:MAG: hypothetical protein ACREBU_16040 [Nitrososphaera sp.]